MSLCFPVRNKQSSRTLSLALKASSQVEHRQMKQHDRTRSYCIRVTAHPIDWFPASVLLSLTQGQLVLHKSKTLRVMALCPETQRENMFWCVLNMTSTQSAHHCLEVVVPLSFLSLLKFTCCQH